MMRSNFTTNLRLLGVTLALTVAALSPSTTVANAADTGPRPTSVYCVAESGAGRDLFFTPGSTVTDTDNVNWTCGFNGAWSVAKEPPKPQPKPSPRPDDTLKIVLTDVLISG